MQFWLRHVFLLLCCVVLPFMAALYVDTSSEIRRTQRAGALASRLASQSLEARLTLDAHETVSAAISLAQRLTGRDLVGEVQKSAPRRELPLAAIADALNAAAPANGFAWLIDEKGEIVARSSAKDAEGASIQKVSGHPLFLETQEGYALDGLWHAGGPMAIIGASPIIVREQAQGAVFVGRPIDASLLSTLSDALNSEISIAIDDRLVLSTLEPRIAESIVDTTAGESEPVSGGTLSKPLGHGYLPLLPLFVEHDARGLAYASIGVRAPGSTSIRWIISVPTAEPLRELAGRQEIVLGGLITFFMLALLIGMVNYRTFVTPIERLTRHVSELQLGRGELELAETTVSAPFRRLVRLINMTVQKIPVRGFSIRAPSPDSPISDVGDRLIVQHRDPNRQTGDILNMGSMSGIEGRGAAKASGDGRGTGSLPSAPASAPEDEAMIAEALASLEGGSPGTGSLPRVPPKDRSASTASRSAAELSSKRPRSAAEIRGVPSESILSSSSPSSDLERSRDLPRSAESKSVDLSRSIDLRTSDLPRSVDLRTSDLPESTDLPRGGQGAQAPAGGDQVGAPLARASSRISENTARDLQSPFALDSLRSGGSTSLEEMVAGVVGRSLVDEAGFSPERTVVAPVQDELLRRTSREVDTDMLQMPSLDGPGSAELTVMSTLPPGLLSQAVGGGPSGGAQVVSTEPLGLDPADHAHFKETYERFIEMRKRCGEATGDLAFDRFLAKLTKNREGLIKKYNCRTVRFQVYEKDGKAALKATPVRTR